MNKLQKYQVWVRETELLVLLALTWLVWLLMFCLPNILIAGFQKNLGLPVTGYIMIVGGLLYILCLGYIFYLKGILLKAVVFTAAFVTTLVTGTLLVKFVLSSTPANQLINTLHDLVNIVYQLIHLFKL